ncbi:uncharacterized protein LOC121517238 [Cheilinus undulatus]|uniref:uncharacterized protein LOC121517238 n=1 Tax=Cheilinus undulatus TaxID=241271 RepID=UPI001BD5A053|nr:uncharacterized protein LOC121517238 [Cheilinus undulatus]
MSGCCISGCKNRHSSTSKIKFYRIPSGYRTFQANRRKLWLKAIEQANGSTEGLKGNVRVCSAHFISGEASMEYGSPDFVPSLFTCTKEKPKKKNKWFMGRRKRRRCSTKAEETTPEPGADSPADHQSSDLIEEPPPLSKDEGTLTEESKNETKTETKEPPTSPCPNKASTPTEAKGIPELNKRIPTLILRRVFTPVRGYQCELCSQNFSSVSRLLKHELLHREGRPISSESDEEFFSDDADITEYVEEPEPAFPCNICDRSFTTVHQLKRHKLLHVKDARKCRICGVLFCKLHNHVVFMPQPEAETVTEEDASVCEPENSLESPEPSQISEPVDDTPHTTFSPLPKNLFKPLKPLPPASHIKVLSEIPIPVLKEPYSVPCPKLGYSRDLQPFSPMKKPKHYNPSADSQSSFPKDFELPPSLQMFSPKFLTSTFFKVTRNYEYILSKAQAFKKEKE